MRIAIFFFLIIVSSCTTKEKYSYAIKDFRTSLHPVLVNIVAKNIAGFDTSISYLQDNATDEELKRLSLSEHPILRAVALTSMIKRKTFNSFDVLMSHLDDTAIVNTDGGEWGIFYQTVSDYLISQSEWENQTYKNKTIDEVLFNHKSLKSAYNVMHELEAIPKYHDVIKEMVQRDCPFEEKEDALYALAQYQRKDDIRIIKNILIQNTGRMNTRSFLLMKNYPDSAYLDVLDKYSQHGLYKEIRNNGASAADLFLRTVAAYENERSAQILNRIINKRPFLHSDSSDLKNEIGYVIRNYQCEAYSKLIKELEPEIIQSKKNMILQEKLDTTSPEMILSKEIRW